MANLEEILKKSQEKLNSKTQQKKIKRDSHSRPWREEGLEFGKTLSSVEPVIKDTVNETSLNAIAPSPLNDQVKPTLHTHNSQDNDLNASKNPDNNSTITRQETRQRPDKHLTTTKQEPDKNPTNDNSSFAGIVNLNTNPDKDPTVTRQETRQRPDKHLTTTKQEPDKNPTNDNSSFAGIVNLNTNPDKDPTVTRQETRQRPDNKPDKNSSHIFDLKDKIIFLPDNPKKVFYHICDSIINDAGEYLITTYKNLAEQTLVSEGSIRSVLKVQLRTKFELISLQSDLGGPQAKVKISVNNDVLRTYLKIQSSSETRQRLDNKPDNRPDKTPPSKLVSNINNSNYLTEDADTKSTHAHDLLVAQNTGWFKTLDFSALTYIKPMMVNSAIRSLVESKLDQDDVQMFVNKFKNWLATQRNIQNPLAIFCDKLKEYANEGDSPVLGVMSDQELQIELLMAQELEKSRLELELVNKARLFKAEQEKEARFQNWISQASDDEKKALYPETGFARIGSEIYNIGLKEAFFNQRQIEG